MQSLLPLPPRLCLFTCFCAQEECLCFIHLDGGTLTLLLWRMLISRMKPRQIPAS